MWLVANEDVTGLLDGVDIYKGERILMEMSRKFTPEDIRQLAFQSNFYVQVALAVIRLSAECTMLLFWIHTCDG